MKTEVIVKTVLQILTFIATFTVVSVIAAGIYAAFYLSFVPKPIHEGPVHFVFEPCNEEMGKCGFLNGSIQLGNPPPVLLTDQKYSLSLELEMPESNINRDLGMFMSCAQILSKDKLLMRKNCRSTIMKYKSNMIRSLELVFMWPAILTDYSGEKQMVHIRFLDDYRDDPMNPALSIDFQVMSRFAEIYHAKYQVQAQFTGLRYILHWFPLTSAVFGITFNFLVLMLLLFFTWYGFLAKPPVLEDNRGAAAEDLDSGVSGLQGEVSDLELLEHEQPPHEEIAQEN